jgi:hypothetical protein
MLKRALPQRQAMRSLLFWCALSCLLAPSPSLAEDTRFQDALRICPPPTGKERSLRFLDLYTLKVNEEIRDAAFRTSLDIATLAGKSSRTLNTSEIYIVVPTQTVRASLPASVADSYPQEITFVLQYQFENLVVHQDSLDVTLWFEGKATQLHIPYAAIDLFLDHNLMLCYRATASSGPVE